MRNCAGALLVRDGRILLVKRALHKTFPGLWDVPGGHCEEDETPEAAMVRELQEELGIAADKLEACDTVLRAPGLMLYLFVIRNWSGEPVMLGDEHTEMEWFPFAEAAAMTGLVTDEYRPIFAALA
jgi:mutator protein MutT